MRLYTRLYAASLLWLVSLILTSCGGAGSDARQPTTPAPEALFTSAAKTAEAMRLERFGTPATPNPQSLIETAAAPSITATLQPTVTGIGIITPTLPVATTDAPPPVASPAGEDKAEFVADITVPDGTVFAPGETFEKIWRILNSGQTTWTTGYELVFIDGDLLGAPASVPMPVEVKPGDKVDIRVPMTAPAAPGDYASYWELRNAQGKLFGLCPTASEAIWVKIVVQEGGVALKTDAPTTTPGGAVSSIVLAVDEAVVAATCPHTYIFTAQITLIRATAVTYALEAGDTGGEQIKVPPPVTRNLEAGTHLAVFELTIPRDVSAWARLRITEPVEMISNQVNFSLSCTSVL